MEYDFLAFIGRFQPFHAGHFKVLKTALEKSQNVVVIVGSANRPRTAKNPLTFEERKELIGQCLVGTGIDKTRVQVVPCDDFLYNDTKWETEIQAIIRTATSKPWRAGPTKIGVIGHSKDHSSYYLKKFPQWDLLDIAQEYVVNATDIRHRIYEGLPTEKSWFMDDVHQAFIEKFLMRPDFIPSRGMDVIFKEYEHIKNYKKQFASMPYPPIFVTTDAVVVQSGHVLLVKRGGMPGEGLLALPGGFLNQGETVKEGVLRELIEETKIGVQYIKLESRIENWFVADHPDRSQRGRTISHAALIRLPDSEQGLPKIKGSDDAADAMWVPLDDLDPTKMFEDHYDIIDQFLGL